MYSFNPDKFHDDGLSMRDAASRIGFFAHSHGSGHLLRSLAIAQHLDMPSTIFCSRPAPGQVDLSAHPIALVQLPDDDWGRQGRWAETYPESLPEGLHCAPVGVAGLRERANMLTTWMAKEAPFVLVVDVSVEVTMLARLCSVPTVVMRMHGQRDDLPHLEAYRSAHYLLAPFSRALEQDSTPDWVRAKTFYAGGISRYQEREPMTLSESKRNLNMSEGRRMALFVTGQGGERFDIDEIDKIAQAMPDWDVVVLGRTHASLSLGARAANLHVLGFVQDIYPFLCAADVVIGSAGDNLVHEIAAVRKPMICIPADRPFEEQQCKAVALVREGLALCVDELDATLDWRGLFDKAVDLDADWSILECDGAAQRAARFLSQMKEMMYVSAIG